jgi:hypothetical protein
VKGIREWWDTSDLLDNGTLENSKSSLIEKLSRLLAVANRFLFFIIIFFYINIFKLVICFLFDDIHK